MHVHTPGYPDSAFFSFSDHGPSNLALLFAIITMQPVSHHIDVPPLSVVVVEFQCILQEYCDSQGIVEWGSLGETENVSVRVSEKEEDLVEKLAKVQDCMRRCNRRFFTS